MVGVADEELCHWGQPRNNKTDKVMLVLRRRLGESIVIDDEVVLLMKDVSEHDVTISLTAPFNLPRQIIDSMKIPADQEHICIQMDEKLKIGEQIIITLVKTRNDESAQLGIETPPDFEIRREG